ncbi:hypothetical protein KY342_01875 [Candidatus Woesearchaeota archaeon]|nr:hypothetical protein [Candidatus Woesearchaeota archaeon]
MIPKTDLDYVKLFASKLREDNSLFEQQKKLIESQMHSSSELFRKRFGTGKDFKKNAREYLKRIGLI